MRALVVLALALAAGCTPTYQEGRFACSPTEACPPGLSCFGDRCYRSPPDAAPSIDMGMPSDAGCGALGCATVRVTNAWSGGPMLPEFTLNDVPFPSLNFGETSPDIQVPLTDASMLTLAITGVGGPMPVTLPSGAARYTVVISESTTSVPMMPTTTILENNFAGAGVVTTLRFGSVIHGGGTFGVDSGAGINTITDFSRLTMGTLAATAGEPIALSLDGEAIAAFSTGMSDLPRAPGGGYYVIFAGRTDHSLLAPDGLRMILATPGLHLRQSVSLVWLLNGTMSTLDVCRPGAGGVLDTIGPGLHGPYLPDLSGGSAFAVEVAATPACQPGGTFFTFPTVTPGPARYLAGVMPPASSGGLQTFITPEPPNPDLQTTPAVQSVLFANQLAGPAALGRWDTGAFVPFDETMGVAAEDMATAFLPAVPTSIALHPTSGPVMTYEYPWQSVAPAHIAFAIATIGAEPALWAVSSPYGHPWTATRALSSMTH